MERQCGPLQRPTLADYLGLSLLVTLRTLGGTFSFLLVTANAQNVVRVLGEAHLPRGWDLGLLWIQMAASASFDLFRFGSEPFLCVVAAVTGVFFLMDLMGKSDRWLFGLGLVQGDIFWDLHGHQHCCHAGNSKNREKFSNHLGASFH